MAHKCEECNKNFETEESLMQHNSSKHLVETKKAKSNFKKYFIFTAIALIVILLVFSVNSYMKKPGQYDSFVNCLTEKGVVVYGNDYCSYTRNQLGMFGKSKNNLNYVKCIDNEALCNEKEVDITPTWYISETKLEGVQGFEKLSELSGCVV